MEFGMNIDTIALLQVTAELPHLPKGIAPLGGRDRQRREGTQLLIPRVVNVYQTCIPHIVVGVCVAAFGEDSLLGDASYSGVWLSQVRP
jgi:hypothetical protein